MRLEIECAFHTEVGEFGLEREIWLASESDYNLSQSSREVFSPLCFFTRKSRGEDTETHDIERSSLRLAIKL